MLEVKAAGARASANVSTDEEYADGKEWGRGWVGGG